MPRHASTRIERVLHAHWKSGARRLKQAKKLPWFVILGSKSGKSTLLAGAELALRFNDENSGMVLPTRTLRWWFFRPVTFLELSSQFVESGNLTRAWRRMVSWFHTAPPLSGIVVCLSVHDLKNNADDMAGAHRIRAQLEPLLEKNRRRLPVYFIITACDGIPGFSQWINIFSPGQQQQPLGYYWQRSPVIDDKDPLLLGPLFDALREGFNNVRLSMFSGKTPDSDTLCVLDLPEQMQALQSPLRRYIVAICGDDACADSPSPLLGGIWFTATEENSKSKNNRKSYFVGELFSQLLPYLSRNSEILYTSRIGSWLNRWGYSFIATVIVLLLMFSAAATFRLITNNKNTDIKSQLIQLARTDDAAQRKVRYLPFSPVMYYHQSQLEKLILSSAAIHHRDYARVIKSYRNNFKLATPTKQRELILALTHAIVIKEELLNQEPLSRLLMQPAVSPELTMTHRAIPLSARQSLLIQRAFLQKDGGRQEMAHLRQLLTELVSDDPLWFVAPTTRIASVHANTFFPGEVDDLSIDGIWTAEGAKQVAFWLKQIRQAAGENTRLPALDRFERQWNDLRQAAWIKFIIQLNRQPVSGLNEQQWSDILLSIDQGSSPATKVAHMITHQLVDIPNKDASRWLIQLRKLVKLQMNSQAGALQQTLSQRKFILHNKLSAWLNGEKSLQAITNPAVQLKSWTDWQTSLNAAVSEALNSSPDTPQLTAGLFTVAEGKESNPLLTLNRHFNTLRKNLASDEKNAGVDAIWRLYEQDKRWLIAHALYRSGCWLQQQWQSTVLWPLSQNARRMDHQSQQDQAGQYISAFIRNAAKNVLAISDTGASAGEFEGQRILLTQPFLHLVNDVLDRDDLLAMPDRVRTRNEDALAMLEDRQKNLDEKLKQLQVTPIDLTLHSFPATIPGGAQLMPTGTQLTLFCDEKRWSLTSMNFDEQALFRWKVGHCNRVTQVIQFPGFNLVYNYTGNAAWPTFLNHIADGQHIYKAKDFPEQAALLRSNGIKEVMVRYRPVNQTVIQDTWQQWKDVEQSLNENAAEQQRRKNALDKSLPTGTPESLLSGLPVKIAHCGETATTRIADFAE